MRTVNIRDLRGAGLADSARQGELLGITNYRQLIGVLVPVTQAWVEHLIEYNWSRVRQSVVEGEQEMAAGTPMTTLDGLLADAGGQKPAGTDAAPGQHPDPQAMLAAAAVTALALGGYPGELPEKDAAGPQARVSPTVRTVRVGDLSAKLIEEAGAEGQTLALTNDRVLVGIVVPVTRGLVEFLVEQNMSRVLYNIALGEKEMSEGGEPLTTLDQVTREAASRLPAPPPAPPVRCDDGPRAR
jgi:antitoxin (DNA-binding transcriptional repressor) of toxin-antitoxin stability system